MDIEEGVTKNYTWGKYWQNYEIIPNTLSGVFGNYPTNLGHKIDFDPYNLTYG